MIDIREVEARTTERYCTDQEFHARVRVAAELTATSMRRATGFSPSADFMAGVIQACAYGLAMAEVDVTNNLDQDNLDNMRRTAEALGFQLIQGEGSSNG